MTKPQRFMHGFRRVPSFVRAIFTLSFFICRGHPVAAAGFAVVVIAGVFASALAVIFYPGFVAFAAFGISVVSGIKEMLSPSPEVDEAHTVSSAGPNSESVNGQLKNAKSNYTKEEPLATADELKNDTLVQRRERCYNAANNRFFASQTPLTEADGQGASSSPRP